MFLIFDTETTTFPSKYLPANHPDQARIVQLACLLVDKDFNELECYNTLFKLGPDTKISDGAFQQHKKTWEMCAKEGIEPSVGMLKFQELHSKAQHLVAHNGQFDLQLLNIEHNVMGIYDFLPHQSICTMQLMTPICKLPNARKNSFGSKYKWPKLTEAHKHCFGCEFDGAHDALADVRATAKVFKWLIDNGHICQTQAVIT